MVQITVKTFLLPTAIVIAAYFKEGLHKYDLFAAEKVWLMINTHLEKCIYIFNLSKNILH